MLLEFLHSWGGGGSVGHRDGAVWSPVRGVWVPRFSVLSQTACVAPFGVAWWQQNSASAGGLSSPALIPQSNQSTDRKKKGKTAIRYRVWYRNIGLLASSMGAIHADTVHYDRTGPLTWRQCAYIPVGSELRRVGGSFLNFNRQLAESLLPSSMLASHNLSLSNVTT